MIVPRTISGYCARVRPSACAPPRRWIGVRRQNKAIRLERALSGFDPDPWPVRADRRNRTVFEQLYAAPQCRRPQPSYQLERVELSAARIVKRTADQRAVQLLLDLRRVQIVQMPAMADLLEYPLVALDLRVSLDPQGRLQVAGFAEVVIEPFGGGDGFHRLDAFIHIGQRLSHLFGAVAPDLCAKIAAAECDQKLPRIAAAGAVTRDLGLKQRDPGAGGGAGEMVGRRKPGHASAQDADIDAHVTPERRFWRAGIRGLVPMRPRAVKSGGLRPVSKHSVVLSSWGGAGKWSAVLSRSHGGMALEFNLYQKK